jgi:hypothetical protein
MFIHFCFDGASVRRDQGLLRSDLCAQLAPLDRFGLAGFSSALVDSLRALFSAARSEREREDCCAHC